MPREMKRFFAGVLIGALVALAIPSHAVTVTPKVETPMKNPTSWIHKICMYGDLVYLLDNSNFNKTPNSFQVFLDNPDCSDT